jgi:hypothetical protein
MLGWSFGPPGYNSAPKALTNHARSGSAYQTSKTPSTIRSSAAPSGKKDTPATYDVNRVRKRSRQPEVRTACVQKKSDC